jgi:anti-sigma regulatory factor (Ser/Thr protein kinase)
MALMGILEDEPPRLEHPALLYGDIDAFLAAMVPFVKEGLEAEEPVVVAVASEELAALRERVGEEGRGVVWLDTREWVPHPASRLRAFHELVSDELARGAARLRMVGEPVWPDGPPEHVLEWERYESVLNEVLAPYPVTLVCTYDTSRVDPSIAASARRTHPTVWNGRDAISDAFVPPAELLRRRNAEVPSPPRGATVMARPDDLAAARQFIEAEAERAGVPPDPAMDLLIAANEVLTNAAAHAGGAVGVWVWVEDGRFMCQVEDRGPGIDDPLAGYLPPDDVASGGRWLWIARQLVDLLQIAPAEPGTRVRLHARPA